MAVATLLLDGFTWTASAGRIFEGEIELGYALLSLFFEVFVVLVHGVMNTALVYTVSHLQFVLTVCSYTYWSLSHG